MTAALDTSRPVSQVAKELGGGGGTGREWEARLIRDAFYSDQPDLKRSVPVVMPDQTVGGVPDFLAVATTSVYHVRDFTVAGAEPLLRLLTGQSAEVQPPLGPRPVTLDSLRAGT